jgi:SAM-dependent MidA family methyltransferase
MRSASQWLARGALLAIDYGFPRREYYHPQRLMGTLMCHYRHRAHADPLWRPGLNDITAHVDFTALADAALESGLDVLGYTTQANFLISCGVLDLLARDRSPQRTSEAQRLLSEAEMGELFKVLAVGRGIAAPLLGFQRGDRRDRL